MRKFQKFSVSIPWKDFQDMEVSRKIAEASRSAYVLEALRRLKKIMEKERLIEAYESGYRRIPEDPALADALARSAGEALPQEDWK
jgi:hypothetical protein